MFLRKNYDVRDIHVFVNISNIFLQVFTNGGELSTTDTDHAKPFELHRIVKYRVELIKMQVPHTFPSLRKSKQVNATTYYVVQYIAPLSICLCALRSESICQSKRPERRSVVRTFLSDFDAPEPVHPVVYSP